MVSGWVQCFLQLWECNESIVVMTFFKKCVLFDPPLPAYSSGQVEMSFCLNQMHGCPFVGQASCFNFVNIEFSGALLYTAKIELKIVLKFQNIWLKIGFSHNLLFVGMQKAPSAYLILQSPLWSCFYGCKTTKRCESCFTFHWMVSNQTFTDL